MSLDLQGGVTCERVTVVRGEERIDAPVNRWDSDEPQARVIVFAVAFVLILYVFTSLTFVGALL